MLFVSTYRQTYEDRTVPAKVHAGMWTQVGDRTIELIKVKSHQTVLQSETLNQAHLHRGNQIVDNLASATRPEFNEHELARYFKARKTEDYVAPGSGQSGSTAPGQMGAAYREPAQKRTRETQDTVFQPPVDLVTWHRRSGVRTLRHSTALDDQTSPRPVDVQQPSRRNQAHPQHPSTVWGRFPHRHSVGVIRLLGMHLLLSLQGGFIGQTMHENSRKYYPPQPPHPGAPTQPRKNHSADRCESCPRLNFVLCGRTSRPALS